MAKLSIARPKRSTGARPQIDIAFARAGIERQTVFDVTDLETIFDLVTADLGIAMLPETIANERRPAVATCKVEKPTVCWELMVAHLRGDENRPVNDAAKVLLTLMHFFDE